MRKKYFSRTMDDITVAAELAAAGDDFNITVTGGEKPHIGSISIAIPRESLTGSGERSATVSTFNLPGHMDDRVGDFFAREVAVHTGHTCIAACGIHIDNLSHEGIDKVMLIARQLLAELLREL